jgi:hypothetical protein
VSGAAVGTREGPARIHRRPKARSDRRGPRVNWKANLPIVVERAKVTRIVSRYEGPLFVLRLRGGAKQILSGLSQICKMRRTNVLVHRAKQSRYLYSRFYEYRRAVQIVTNVKAPSDF